MKESLLLHGKQVLKQGLEEPLKKGLEIKARIEELEQIQGEINELEKAFSEVQQAIAELKEEEIAIEANSLRKELREKVQSVGDAKLTEKYEHFAGGSLEVVRLVLPDELMVYATGMTVSEAKNKITQLIAQKGAK